MQKLLQDFTDDELRNLRNKLKRSIFASVYNTSTSAREFCSLIEQRRLVDTEIIRRSGIKCQQQCNIGN